MKALIINCSPVRTGATDTICRITAEELAGKYDVKSVCIDDYRFAFCKGCRSCHKTAKCVQHDDVDLLIHEFEEADVIVCVAPSYWADVPGQFKAFIDRCTPWCNTHEPYATIGGGKKGDSIVLRTGPNMPELEHLIRTIEHFYGHMEIECCGRLGLTAVEYKEDVAGREEELRTFVRSI